MAVEGQWVQVWAQVAAPSRTHPEDITVKIRSHSDEYTADVWRDRVHETDEVPDFAAICTALVKTATSCGYADTYTRCALVAGHGDDRDHRAANGDEWADSRTIGYFEDA